MTALALGAGVSAKAVLVDGPSTYHMKQAIGITGIDLKRFYDLLVRRVGTITQLAFAPVMTMNPRTVGNTESYVKSCHGAGFDARPDGDDDGTLIALIQSIDPKKVAEIVIVTADKDFIPSLLEKVAAGVTVYWVSTLHKHPDDNHRYLSRDVIELAHSGMIKLIELAKFAPLIRANHRREAATMARGPHFLDRGISSHTITMHCKDPQKHLRLWNEIQRLVGSHGDAVTVESDFL